jgi:hypothetical protein
MSTLPNFPSPASPEQLTQGPPAVQLTVAGPAPQRRLTVLFRLLMVIPHGIALFFLAIAAFFTAFVGWWAALFGGRLPQWAHTYLGGFFRWLTRVQAYGMLLTDVYPPFSLDDQPGYPVRILVPPREQLNPWAVFFRFILVIPVSVLITILSYGGMTIVAFIAWLITLITGRLPNGLHLAYTAVLRFQTRAYCYQYLLTPTYPNGLYGDGLAVAAAAQGDTLYLPAADLPAAGDWAPPGAPDPAADWAGATEPGTGGYGTPVGYGTPGGYGTPFGYGAPADDGTPGDWRLLLTKGARQLLTLFIVLGAVLYVGNFVANRVFHVSLTGTTQSPDNRIKAANTTLTTELSGYQTTVRSCTVLSCVTTADTQAATDFSNFAATLHSISMPANAVGPANQLYSDATTIARDLTKLSQVTSSAQYQSTVASTGLDQELNQFDTDENALGDALANPN